jgi:DNA (cytosine-5)-methyltransferase 1
MARPPESLGWILETSTKMSKSDDLMDKSSVLSPENRRRAEYLIQHDLYDLPLDQRPDCHKNGTTYTASYGRMRINSPAPTLTTGFFSPGRGRFIHPTEPRTLTAREGSMVQGFPSYYQFNPTGRTTRVNLGKWIGDAVPPILGYVAAKSLGY